MPFKFVFCDFQLWCTSFKSATSLYRCADRSLARPGKKQCSCQNGANFRRHLASRGGGDLMTCFRTCYRYGRAKDLSAPQYNSAFTCRLDKNIHDNQIFLLWYLFSHDSDLSEMHFDISHVVTPPYKHLYKCKNCGFLYDSPSLH